MYEAQAIVDRGSDPLAVLAAQIATQDADVEGGPGIDDTSLDVSEAHTSEATTSLQPHSMSLHQTYASLCASKGLVAPETYCKVLEDVPESLWIKYDPSTTPRACAGGAVISDLSDNIDESNVGEMESLVELLSIPQPLRDSRVLLLDHLDLSNSAITVVTLKTLVDNAARLGPWWRLRSLEIRNCSLTVRHLGVLCSIEAQPFLWHLQRLNVADNPTLSATSLKEFASPQVALLGHLWRQAPLKYVNFIGANLANELMAACLRSLCTYPLPSGVCGCGVPLHDGTRPVLQCIKLSSPSNGERYSDLLLQQIGRLMEAAPNLLVVEMHGAAGPTEREALTGKWKAARSSLAIQVAEVRPGVVRFAAGTAVCELLDGVEIAPARHTLPGPATPGVRGGDSDHRRANLAEEYGPAILDDWDLGVGVGLQTGNAVPPEGQHLPPQPGRAAGTTLPPRQPRYQTHRAAGNIKHATSRPRSERSHGVSTNIGSTRPRKRRSNDAAPRPSRIYRGGRAEDELPDGGEDICSEEGRRSSSSDDSYTDEDDDGNNEDAGLHGSPLIDVQYDHDGHDHNDIIEQGGVRADIHRFPSKRHQPHAPRPPLGHNEPFKMRDGALDLDSKYGRMYRRTAKEYIDSIGDIQDQKGARAAYKVWDTCAANAWDRRRWENPSKDQNDEPMLLGQLNKLYDIFDKHGITLGFPFPMWKKGHGPDAFLAKHQQRGKAPSGANPMQRTSTSSLPMKRPSRSPIPLAGNKGEQKTEQKLSASTARHWLDDGGCGHGSDDEHDNGDGTNDDDGFTIFDDIVEVVELESNERCTLQDQVVGAANQESEEQIILASKQVHRREALIDDDDDDDDGDDDEIRQGAPSNMASRPPQGQGAKKSINAPRELARLSAWGWDTRIDDHPPNEDIYGPATGKRSRRQRVTGLHAEHILAAEGALLESEKQNEELPVAFYDDFSDASKHGEEDTTRDADEVASSDDDDVPLAQYYYAKQQEGAADGGQTTPPTSVAPIEVPNGLQSEERAAALARALLGNLYVAPVPPPAQPSSKKGESERAPAAYIIPDSQDNDDQYV